MPPLPLLLPPPPPSSTAVPRSLQPRVANLVLLPSSGLSAESTEPVNYSLMHRVPILLFSDPESLSLSSKGYSFPIISSPNSLRPGDLKVDALLRVRFTNVLFSPTCSRIEMMLSPRKRGDFSVLPLSDRQPFIVGVAEALLWNGPIRTKRFIIISITWRKIRRLTPASVIFVRGVGCMIYRFLGASARLINASPMPFRR